MDVTDFNNHTLIGFANPFLRCKVCNKRTTYHHDSVRCGCRKNYYVHPCKHASEAVSICPSWNPVDGCTCKKPEDDHKMPNLSYKFK